MTSNPTRARIPGFTVGTPFQFPFLPVAVFGGGTSFPVYAQAAVFDVATGELRLSNLDAHIYSL